MQSKQAYFLCGYLFDEAKYNRELEKLIIELRHAQGLHAVGQSEKIEASRKNSSSSSTQRKCAFARKCARLVKEQRARFYIMRHCVIMLICWHDGHTPFNA
ncbi:hypothetical protein JHK82_040300 [Glycine max]|nr:hypothetical protein JHK82_040300 [Glycine max]